jgi:hypothetical protein
MNERMGTSKKYKAARNVSVLLGLLLAHQETKAVVSVKHN